MKINNFSEYYDKLGVLERREFRKTICEGTNIEYHSFMRRLRGNTWSPFEREAIERIIKQRRL